MVASDDESLCYGSVCSGIEAVTLAWRPLKLRAAWFAEIDPFASALLAHRYPGVVNLGDMTGIAQSVTAGRIRAPDILVGGTPCQSFSVAGVRKGLDDPRGALTLKYVELANAIDEGRAKANQSPCTAIWENVPGVLSDRDNAFGCFLGALVGEACELRPAGRSWTNAGCVYGPKRAAAWRVVDAQYFGVAQRRKRVFVVACGRKGFDPCTVLFEPEGVRGNSPARAKEQQDVAPASAAGVADSGPTKGQAQDLMSLCFGGGNTGPIERAACLMGHGYRGDFETDTFALQALSPVSHPLTCASAVAEDGQGRGVPVIAIAHNLKGCGWPGKYEPLTLAFAQNSRGELRLENCNGQVTGCLSAGGGIPGQWFPVVVSMNVSGEPQRALSEFGDNLASTLRASDGSGNALTFYPSTEVDLRCVATKVSGAGYHDEYTTWRVRRLMPLQCERLQGMPDNYTLVPYRGKPAADACRYKAIGNSMAVPCVSWIGARLLEEVRWRRSH